MPAHGTDSHTGEAGEIVRAVCELCMHLVGSDGAAISLFDQSGDIDVVYATDATALLLSDLSADFDSSEWAAMASRNGIGSFLFRGIDAGAAESRSRAGVIQMYSRDKNVFDAVTANALAVCADMASEALTSRLEAYAAGFDFDPALRMPE